MLNFHNASMNKLSISFTVEFGDNLQLKPCFIKFKELHQDDIFDPNASTGVKYSKLIDDNLHSCRKVGPSVHVFRFTLSSPPIRLFVLRRLVIYFQAKFTS